ncbi:hypothetical protein [Pseudomonas sp. TSRC2-2]|uniref:hypothetical protein n=1 Tax=unclassified Pseudomonas TaxID=196821 RepID=UPI003CEE9D83
MSDMNATFDTDAAITAGPAVSLRFSGAGNPNKVRRGNSLEKLPAGDALDAQGNIVPGISGSFRLETPLPGVSVFSRGGLNGRVAVTNVQQNMTIRVVVTTQTSPPVTGFYTVIVEVIG